jgi:hypothetical protein
MGSSVADDDISWHSGIEDDSIVSAWFHDPQILPPPPNQYHPVQCHSRTALLGPLEHDVSELMAIVLCGRTT